MTLENLKILGLNTHHENLNLFWSWTIAERLIQSNFIFRVQDIDVPVVVTNPSYEVLIPQQGKWNRSHDPRRLDYPLYQQFGLQ